MMNTLKDMAVLNIIKTDGRWAPQGKQEGLKTASEIEENSECFKEKRRRKPNDEIVIKQRKY